MYDVLLKSGGAFGQKVKLWTIKKVWAKLSTAQVGAIAFVSVG